MKLVIRGLCVELQRQPILHDVCLDVRGGEFLSLLGPSGCGKTTLLKAVAGLLPLKSGALSLDGQDISALPAHKRGTVIVFQDNRLFPHMTAAENVAFSLRMRGVPKAERQKKALEFLGLVQLSAYGDRRISELSGGQLQRVALARALAAHPRLLLLDEPFSSLDENLREEMRTLVLGLHRELGMTTVLVTHDREEALSISDRVAVMQDGRVVQCGTPEEVYTRPASRLVADYFGGGVYLPGQVRDGRFTAGRAACAADLPDGAYELLLRPSALLTDRPGGYPVRVGAARFRGDSVRLTLTALDGTVWTKAFPTHPGWREGDLLDCALDLSQAVFFPRDPPDSKTR